MELDRIIYDKDTLAAALIEQWNSESETFKAMYPSDTAVSLANIMAGYGAMLQYILVSAMANCYTDTAYTEMGVYQLAQTLGNSLHGNNSAQVRVNITKKNFIGIKTDIPAFTQFTIDGKKFFNPYDIIFPATVDKVTDIVLLQGERITVTKTSNGIKNERFYFSNDFKASSEYITVKVNDEEWDVKDSLLEFDQNYVLNLESLKTVVLKTDPDGRSYIRFGDGQFGSLPPADSIVEIIYVSNEGSLGNIAETDVQGQLDTELVYSDNYGKYATLDVEIFTTTTAYGGFDKQSLETLRQTSPWVFASGHRAIRRKDYDALLQNKCGYLTSKTWGEYEQSNIVGAYDSLMNDMVYYTGVKSFQYYPTFLIDYITEPDIYSGSIHSTRGFYGSYNLSITNNVQPENTFSFTDNKGKGLLFINNNQQDPRDDLLADWVKLDNKHAGDTVKSGYEMNIDSLGNSGHGYEVGDKLVLRNTNNELAVEVLAVTLNGEVTEISWAETEEHEKLNIASQDWTASGNSFETAYMSGTSGLGTGLIVNISNAGIYKSALIYTNDDRTTTEAKPVQYHPISHARSDASNEQYYQSLYSPSLLNPVQIIVDYGFDDSEEYIEKTSEGIAAIKFKAAPSNLGTFIGTVAVFGTEDADPSFENIRNNENWTKLLNRTTLNNPYNNNNENWTDWLPLNTVEEEYEADGKPHFKKYRYYVIEFYSCENNPLISNPLITFSKMKFLYGDSSSIIHYNDNFSTNGKIYLRFPYNDIINSQAIAKSGSFPADWGNLNEIKESITYNEKMTGFVSVLSYHFDNGVLPVIVRPDSDILEYDLDLFEYKTSSTILYERYNSAFFDVRSKVWVNAWAEDAREWMQWSDGEPGSSRRAYGTLPYESAMMSKYHYPLEYATINNRPTVYSTRFNKVKKPNNTYEITDTVFNTTHTIDGIGEVIEIKNTYYSLLGTENYPFYNYTPTVKNITRDNGYRNGNILSYVYKNEVGDILPFYVTVNDIDNGMFTYTLKNSSILADNIKLDSASELSLDDTLVYGITNSEIIEPGTGYSVGDEFVLTGYNYSITTNLDGTVYATDDTSQTVIGTLDPSRNAIVNNDEIISHVTGTLANQCHLENNIGYNTDGDIIGCPIFLMVTDTGGIEVHDLHDDFYGWYNSIDNGIYDTRTAVRKELSIFVSEVDEDGKILSYQLSDDTGDVNLLTESEIYITPNDLPAPQSPYFASSYCCFNFRAEQGGTEQEYEYYLNGIKDQNVIDNIKFVAHREYKVFTRSYNENVILTKVTWGSQIGNVIAEPDKYYIMSNYYDSTFLGLTNKTTYYATNLDETEVIGYVTDRVSGTGIQLGSIMGESALYTNLYAYQESTEQYTDIIGNTLIGKILSTNASGALVISWINDQFVGKPIINGLFSTKALKGNGSGLVLDIQSICKSGANNVPGNGATIKIESNNNLSFSGTFVGNRIDTKDVNYLDQPIIKRYNHFTTFLEYVQPQIVPLDITLTVSLNTNANLTSSMIIQNIQNNIRNLFNIVPEYIGKGVKISDIYTAVMNVPNVNWCRVNYPNGNIDILEYEMLVCVNIKIIESD